MFFRMKCTKPSATECAYAINSMGCWPSKMAGVLLNIVTRSSAPSDAFARVFRRFCNNLSRMQSLNSTVYLQNRAALLTWTRVPLTFDTAHKDCKDDWTDKWTDMWTNMWTDMWTDMCMAKSLRSVGIAGGSQGGLHGNEAAIELQLLHICHPARSAVACLRRDTKLGLAMVANRLH